ncbi:helix-turn-helix domain-containing protein [Aliidiomarina celeris]|uniref:helix-turn-helix domain-containing protein n=1 Tax=Aliidiomarina celeris TaxID=2249428 RepID=UPI000DEB1313|nr:helix-turn-helix transcriptional regulator [Aliidiomarina celeris]
MGKHFALVPFVLLLSIALASLPAADFQEMFFSSEMVSSTWLISLSAAFALSLVLWFFLSFGYLWSIFRRNLAYRKQVKLIFADEANRNLNWIILTSCLITFTWVYSLIVLAAENKLQQFGFSETGVLILLSIVVWLFAHKGIKQQGGFSDTTETADVISEVTQTKAYQNSALRETDLERIAEKLTVALASDKLHLDSSLNLVKLARNIAEPAQYVSQTLSQHLHTTFFDFINKARIDDAKKLLASTNDSVLDIAYATGFNSRSAFYKAFKQYTQQTPREFRLSFPLGKDERSP